MPQFVTSDDVTLHYTDDGSGPTVVLVSGFRAPAASWVFQRADLNAAGYRVLCLDRRGHGRSQSPSWGHRLARHGQDLAEFLGAAAPGPDRVTLVGASMGASVVWAYLDLVGPDRINAVVSVDQTPRMANTTDWPHGFYGYDRTNLGTFFADGPPAHTGHGVAAEDYRARFARLRLAMGDDASLLDLGPLSPTELELLLDHAVADWRDVIARTAVPILFVAGAESQFWPASHASAAAALSPAARAVVVPDCGHAVEWESPERFNAILRTYLADLAR